MARELAAKVITEKPFECISRENYQKALEAFTLNRLINDAKKARKVLDALIEANKGMWPELR